jgi:hypothetical protein
MSSLVLWDLPWKGLYMWVVGEELGKAWPELFTTFLELPNCISSHDSFNWVFAHLNL